MESGGSGVAEPSSDKSEEDLGATETVTSKTEPSHMEMCTTEPSKPEACEAEPKKAMKKRAKGRRSRGHRRGRDDFPSFAIYFSRVLRQVHTGLSLSRMAVNVMDSFVKDVLEQIAQEAGRLASSKKRRTIITEDIQTAVRLVLPGEIYKYAISEATKSLMRYDSCR